MERFHRIFRTFDNKYSGMKHRFLILFLLIFFPFISGTAQVKELPTWYEQSGMKETPRYKETMDYCRALEAKSEWVHLVSFGRSGQGRDLPLLLVDRQGFTRPEKIRAAGRILLLIQACIHPGEPEGKDAGLMLIRDLVILHKFPGLLDRVSILFIPIFNADGHERFGPFNRINQNGPKETGWRVTATNLNLNRDFLKADAPEMKAWLKMFSTWMPDFFIDTHTTDGADYQYVLTYQMEIYGNMDPGLTEWTRNSFLTNWTGKMKDAGYPVFPYIEFRSWHDPMSGIENSVAPPMLSQGYTSLLNRPGLLIETHMLKTYEQRVSGTYEALVSALEILSGEAEKLRTLERHADEDVSSSAFRQKDFPLRFETTGDSTLADFLGIDFGKVKSEITGEKYYVYGKTKTTFRLPVFSTTKPAVTARLPEAYIIPAEWKTVIDLIGLHGIKYTLTRHDTDLMVAGWKLSNPRWQTNPYEGRHPLVSFTPSEISGTRKFSAGSAIIDLAQPGARIIAQMLEPGGDGSLLYWGFFDAIFEQKEYAENYVMEPLAVRMLAEDPALKAEFEKKKAMDTAFAKNPNAILNWFYNKSPYRDPAREIYPVCKLTNRALVDVLVKNNR
jgi:murein tripeptide amidase MpaA